MRKLAVARTLLASVFCVLAACEGTDGPGATGTTGGNAGGAGTTGGSAGGAGGAQGSATATASGTGGQSTGAAGQNTGAGGQSAGTGGQSTGASGATGMTDGGGAAGSSSGTDGSVSDGQVRPDGGADADAAAGLTLPVMRGNLDVLEVGPLSFTVNPAVGARITSFKLDGDELLTDTTAHAQYFGSTMWTSPASDWVIPGTFVPPPVVDSLPYTTTVSADGVITATSGPATAMMNTKRFVVTKVFHADLAKNAIVIDYKIMNTGTAAFQLSHWEVTRVTTGGLMFFPTGGTPKLDFLMQTVQIRQAGGHTWYDNTTHMMGRGESKGGTDSPGGFIAYVAPRTKGDLLFIKAFKAITTAAQPPGHYPIEFYCNDPHTYLELEDHSSYDSIAPGATYTQTVTWYLRRLPVGTDRSVGSAALLAAVMSTLGR